MSNDYFVKAKTYLDILCDVKPNRRVGSAGNNAATDFFTKTLTLWGYAIDTASFECLDFESGETSLLCDGESFDVYISPFTLGCNVSELSLLWSPR